jgi:hypothetical protein
MTRDEGGGEAAQLQRSIGRLRSSIMAVTFALAGGTGMLVATAWLVIRGGDPVGPHLGLLNNFFPGYSVTWLGAPIGFFYGALVGTAAGWLLARVYNQIADRRAGSATIERPPAGAAEAFGGAKKTDQKPETT